MWRAVDDRTERVLNGDEFEAARERDQSDVSSDRVTERIDEPPNGVAIDRLGDAVQEKVDVVGGRVIAMALPMSAVGSSTA